MVIEFPAYINKMDNSSDYCQNKDGKSGRTRDYAPDEREYLGRLQVFSGDTCSFHNKQVIFLTVSIRELCATIFLHMDVFFWFSL